MRDMEAMFFSLLKINMARHNTLDATDNGSLSVLLGRLLAKASNSSPPSASLGNRALNNRPLRSNLLARLCAVCIGLVCTGALAGGGPLGIDHRLSYDNSGIWKRSNQTALQNLLIVGEFAGGIYEGGETRLGKTFWQSIDSSLLAAASTEGLKYAFTRARPVQNNDPNSWFQGSGHYSFPSGEVAAVTSHNYAVCS